MVLAALLFWGLLTQWVPARLALSSFQVVLFALAAIRLLQRSRRGDPLQVHPMAALLALAIVWCVTQILAGWTVHEAGTIEAALNWTANLAGFALALDLDRWDRERFLKAVLWFAAGLSVIAVFTSLTSPAGRVFWIFQAGTGLPTLGPFVYRNQYASFVEAVLPLAILRAILDRQRRVLYTIIGAALFGSVIAGGSRAGAILCLAEIVLIPIAVFARGLISGSVIVKAVGGSLLSVGLLTAVVGWEQIWARLQEPNPYSLRRELVLSSVEMVRDRPWTGFGLGSWSQAYPAYAHFDDGKFVNQAHNDWVQWAAEGGIGFLILMLAVVALSVRPALRTIWGLGVIVVFVHCLVDYPMQQRPALAVFFFAMLGAMWTVPGEDNT